MLSVSNQRRKSLLVAVTLAVTTLCAATAAHAGRCNRVKLNITNSYVNEDGKSKKIRVRKIIYYNKDDSRWRKDRVSKTEILNGHTTHVTEGLEGSDNQWVTKIQIVFQEKKGDGWSDEHWCSNVNKNFSGECNDGRSYKLEVTGVSPCKG